MSGITLAVNLAISIAIILFLVLKLSLIHISSLYQLRGNVGAVSLDGNGNRPKRVQSDKT